MTEVSEKRIANLRGRWLGTYSYLICGSEFVKCNGIYLLRFGNECYCFNWVSGAINYCLLFYDLKKVINQSIVAVR